MTDYNNAADQITNGAIGDFVGSTAAEMYADRPDIVEDISRCFAEKASFQREMDYKFKSSGEEKRLVVQYAYVPPDLVLVQTEDVSELQKALEEAFFERDLMQSILDTALDTMAVLDAHTLQYVKWNKAITRITGYSDEEFPTLHPIKTFFDEAELPRVEAAMEELMRVGTVTTTVTHINKDGTRFPLDYTGATIKDDEGNDQYFVFIGRDITERLKVEEALKASEAKLQSQAALLEDIFETNVDTIEIFDPESIRYVMWNQAVNKISGYTDEEIAEMDPIRDFIEEPELAETLATLEKTVEEGEAATRTVVVSKDGSRIPMDYRTSLVKDPGGNPIYIIAIGRDISEQVKLEDALRKSEATYRELVENISDVIYTVDSEGLVTYVSPSIEPFLGLPPERLIGQSFAQYVVPEDLDRVTDSVQQLMSGNSPGPNEYRIKPPSGEIRWIRVSSRPIISEGRITGLQGVMTDITEAKLIEEQLEKEAAIAERQRLARELHDSATQTLYGIDLYSNATQEALSSGKIDTALKNIRQIQDLSRSALADMRLLIFELQPPILIEKGLARALRERLDLVEARAGFNTSLRVNVRRADTPND